MSHRSQIARKQRGKRCTRSCGQAWLGLVGLCSCMGTLVQPALAQTQNSLLPRNLSPWGMFMNADIVVKAVMVGLAFASLVTWTIWLAKSLEVFGGKLRARRAADAIGNAATLMQACRELGHSGGPGALLVRAAEEERALSAGALDHVSGDGLKERVASRLSQIGRAHV